MRRSSLARGRGREEDVRPALPSQRPCERERCTEAAGHGYEAGVVREEASAARTAGGQAGHGGGSQVERAGEVTLVPGDAAVAGLSEPDVGGQRAVASAVAP